MSKWDVLAERLSGEALIHNAKRKLARQSDDGISWDAYNHGMAVAYSECAYLVDQTVSMPDPKPSKWHRVEDETPELYKIVFVRDANKGMYTDYLKDNGKWNSGAKVEYWRELPKPPKKERTK
jgi:hypothetical protein